MDLDIDGFLFGPEFAAILASVFTAFFSSFANIFIGNTFSSGA